MLLEPSLRSFLLTNQKAVHPFCTISSNGGSTAESVAETKGKNSISPGQDSDQGNYDALVELVRSSSLVPVFETPPALERATSRLQSAMVDSPKRFRQMGKHLIQNIKKRSLSKHRGGIQPDFFDRNNGLQLLRGSKRQQEKHALKALVRDLSRETGLTYENIEDIVVSHPSNAVLKASATTSMYQHQTKKLGPKLYNGLGALAYATARLPSTYAAVRNVFHRLKISRRYDGWEPHSMLDFGAGPGTAAWAAHSVWSSSPLQVTAVEISSSMADIGYEILKDVKQAMSLEGSTKDTGALQEQNSGLQQLDIRWRPFLPRDQKRMATYDICIASYSLNEIDNKVERHRLLQKLMHSCREYLVLIEPGTPHGFSTIEESRRYILSVSKKLGIPFHVASPCPHDGACPLASARSWCHFSQRHLRTDEQRIAVKSLTGKAPRNTYNERFSYVILKRGARKTISSSFPKKLSKRQDDSESQEDGRDLQALIQGGEKSEDTENTKLVANSLQDSHTASHIAKAIKSVPNSRVLRTRKRKGHVVLDLCSALSQDGAYIGDARGTILRQTVSKGKQIPLSNFGNIYKASKTISQGDEWPLLYQIGLKATETPILSSPDDLLSDETDLDEDEWIDEEEWQELQKVMDQYNEKQS